MGILHWTSYCLDFKSVPVPVTTTTIETNHRCGLNSSTTALVEPEHLRSPLFNENNDEAFVFCVVFCLLMYLLSIWSYRSPIYQFTSALLVLIIFARKNVRLCWTITKCTGQIIFKMFVWNITRLTRKLGICRRRTSIKTSQSMLRTSSIRPTI